MDEKEDNTNKEEILRPNDMITNKNQFINKLQDGTVVNIIKNSNNSNQTVENMKRIGFDMNTQFLTNTYTGEIPVHNNAWKTADNKIHENVNESKNISENINTLPIPFDDSKAKKK